MTKEINKALKDVQESKELNNIHNMTDKEVDVLIDYIVDEYNFDCICDKLHETDYCNELICTKVNEDECRECVREYARVKAEEQANECS